jgi:hypothetical protein
MKFPPELEIREAICTGITQIGGEPGVYAVDIVLDGVHELFHVELEGLTSTFNVREDIYYKYKIRCFNLKGFVPLMREWHSGQRRDLPVNLAEVDWG